MEHDYVEPACKPRTSPAHLEARTAHSGTQEDFLCEFSQKMVDLLVDEAARALQAPDHGGLDFAACLLQDALKYDSLYCCARGVPDERLFDAAQKLRKGNIIQNVNR